MTAAMAAIANTVKRRVELLAYELRRSGGDLDRLDGRIADGVWAAQHALPIMDLAVAEQELRSLADAVKKRRENLLTNVPQAAE